MACPINIGNPGAKV
jgi:hypothetical protein